MALFIVCYHQHAGSMLPAEFEMCLRIVGKSCHVQPAMWLLRANHQSAADLRTEIAEKMEERGDELVERRYLFVAEISGRPAAFMTLANEIHLLNFLDDLS